MLNPKISMLKNLEARHPCGVCDADSLEYVGSIDYQDGTTDHWWKCSDCHESHTSRDCCDNPVITAGDWIVLTKMDDDPNPIPIGTFGQVTAISRLTDGTAQVSVRWEGNSSRNLMLVLPQDRYEKVFVMEEIHV